jgi:hypothetical protein
MGEQWNETRKISFFIKGCNLSFSKETFGYLSFVFLKQEARDGLLLEMPE